ncbi:hypothetical protein ABIF90_000576 [Bradyrhizobium japonicum]
MAPLPKTLDLEAMRLRLRLHSGEREAVKERCAEILAEGKERPEIQKLTDELAGAKRGRPATGAKYLWFELGERNEHLRDAGHKYEVRLRLLGEEFDLRDESKIKTILAAYRKAMDEYDANVRED